MNINTVACSLVGVPQEARSDSQLHGMNPEGTGSLTDHDQLWQSVTKSSPRQQAPV